VSNGNLIIFGASTLGNSAYHALKISYNIQCFCDNDKNKWGKKLNGVEIKSPDILTNEKNVRVIIASMYSEEIGRQLRKLGIGNFYIFKPAILSKDNLELNKTLRNKDIDLSIQEINLGRFLMQTAESFTVEDMAFLHNGSFLQDYIFLKALAKKFEVRTYLEIGSFMGESISSVAEFADVCYSVSLPDENAKALFKNKYKKNNFSRYFSRKKSNVIHYECDSKIFDFNSIKETIDLVFIDGDHTYEGVVSDTQKIFEAINRDETIVVWHDFKFYNRGYWNSIVKAVFDTLPAHFHNQVFATDNNMCGIYIPKKYLSYFETINEASELFSYEITVKPKRNLFNGI
jgi:predicted O-methyltransferase YrrM